jgi:hypothetical protein
MRNAKYWMSEANLFQGYTVQVSSAHSGSTCITVAETSESVLRPAALQGETQRPKELGVESFQMRPPTWHWQMFPMVMLTPLNRILRGERA